MFLYFNLFVRSKLPSTFIGIHKRDMVRAEVQSSINSKYVVMDGAPVYRLLLRINSPMTINDELYLQINKGSI